MPYPSVDSFTDILLSDSLDNVVRQYVFEGTPFVFRNYPQTERILYRHLGPHLASSKDDVIPEENIIVVGSAKIGFSLSPNTFPRRFSTNSDIDVLVVDKTLFDSVWITLLKWHYPRRLTGLTGPDQKWAQLRRKELYWGWFIPSEIRYKGLSFPDVLKPLREISAMWFNAFQSLSLYPELADRKVTGRLYRTWNHALAYHMDGLRQIKDSVLQTRGGA
jgi:hypothetical protein